MADPKMQESESQRINKALAEAANEAEERQMDETVPGGRYKVGDTMYDAEGKEIGEKDAE